MKGKRKLLLYIILLTVIFPILNADLIKLYKSGHIKLEPEPGFGENVDWESLFYDNKKDLVAAPDGSIFVTNSSAHNIFRFNSRGQLVETLGREGYGPGDLNFPNCTSILDGKYLVIPEYAELRRISIFDFSGKCVRVLKTNCSCFDAVALKGNRIAYYSLKSKRAIEKGMDISGISVFIKDILTGKETEIESFELPSRYIPLKTGGAISSWNFTGTTFLEQTGQGNLLLGVSNSAAMKVYSPEGKLLKTFQLNISPVRVTGRFVQEVKDVMLQDIQEFRYPGEFIKAIEKAVKKTNFKKLFDEYLPYYRQVWVDSEGNILVFKWLDCIGKHNEVFQVYSPAGEFLCETILDEGIYDVDLSGNFQAIQFTDKGIFGIFKLADDEDIYRLVKVKVK